MNLGLKGKSVLIAGASRGIGLAVARSFLREGTHVVLVARDSEKLDLCNSKLSQDFPSSSILVKSADLTEQAGINSAFQAAESRFGSLHAVISAIGNGSYAANPPYSAADWDSALRVNLLASSMLTETAIERMSPSRKGSIVLIGSIAGAEDIKAPTVYAAAKAALNAAAKSYARIGAAHGIRVNVVLPGNIIHPDSVWADKAKNSPEWLSDYLAREVPLNRLGHPEEIADVVAFLASDRASFMTGSMVKVDGGQTRSY